MKKGKYPAVIYCSVFGKYPPTPKKEIILRNQELICRNYAKNNNYLVTKVIEDYRYSPDSVGEDFMKFIFSCKKKEMGRYLIISKWQVIGNDFLEFYQNFSDYKNIWIVSATQKKLNDQLDAHIW